MVSFFARHEGNQKVGGEEWYKDNGKISWLLWGGDVGKKWANSIWKKHKKENLMHKKEDVMKKGQNSIEIIENIEIETNEGRVELEEGDKIDILTENWIDQAESMVDRIFLGNYEEAYWALVEAMGRREFEENYEHIMRMYSA